MSRNSYQIFLIQSPGIPTIQQHFFCVSKDHLGKLSFLVQISTYMHVSWKPKEHSPAIIDMIMYKHRLLSHSGDILVLQFRNPVYHGPRYFDFKGFDKGTSKFKPSHKVCVLSLLCKWSIKLASLFFFSFMRCYLDLKEFWFPWSKKMPPVKTFWRELCNVLKIWLSGMNYSLEYSMKCGSPLLDTSLHLSCCLAITIVFSNILSKSTKTLCSNGA